jgi:hypothetical protein
VSQLWYDSFGRLTGWAHTISSLNIKGYWRKSSGQCFLLMLLFPILANMLSVTKIYLQIVTLIRWTLLPFYLVEPKDNWFDPFQLRCTHVYHLNLINAHLDHKKTLTLWNFTVIIYHGQILVEHFCLCRWNFEQWLLQIPNTQDLVCQFKLLYDDLNLFGMALFCRLLCG